jgi:UDP-N-acetylmuramate--alanine ligase
MERYQNIFIVGIKGVAMANIASMLSQMGKKVIGYDTCESQITDEICKNYGLFVHTHFSDLPQETDLVIYGSAHGGSLNPYVVQAHKRAVACMHQAQVIAAFIAMAPHSVAVCGCHGKTGTTALVAYTLHRLGARVSWLVGAPSFRGEAEVFPGGMWRADTDVFVFEADEYAIDAPRDRSVKLRFYTPTHILCTNIDFDHPDIYSDLEHTKREFLDFFSRVASQHPSERRLVLCANDPPTTSLLPHLSDASYLLYADSKSFTGSLPGEKNRTNASGVVAMARILGFGEGESQKAMCGFCGVKRRMEHVLTRNGVQYYDDYGHHPAEIEATIQAFREKYPSRRLVVLFQPHTFSRTHALKDAFVSALSKADEVYIDNIFPSAREKSGVVEISSYELERQARTYGFTHIHASKNRQSLINEVRNSVKPGDVVVTLGAGDIYTVIPHLV